MSVTTLRRLLKEAQTEVDRLEGTGKAPEGGLPQEIIRLAVRYYRAPGAGVVARAELLTVVAEYIESRAGSDVAASCRSCAADVEKGKDE